MFRNLCWVVVFLLLMTASTFSQPTANDDEETAETEEAVAPEAPVVLEGDAVHLVSGKSLRGVRVVRETPICIEVEYLSGEPLLRIPRKQVSHVEYFHRNKEDEYVSPPGLPPSEDIIPGEEISADFHRALTSPLSLEPLEFDGADYLVVLRELCGKANVEIDIPETLTAISEEERRFGRLIPANTTLMSFLRNDLMQIAPEVRVLLQYDRIVLQKRELEIPQEPAPLPTDPAPSGL